MTIDERRLAELERYYDDMRALPKDWEIRTWHERPPGHVGTPSHWVPLAWTTSRQEACTVAEALHRAEGGRVEVWCISENQCYDSYPRKRYGVDGRTPSGQ